MGEGGGSWGGGGEGGVASLLLLLGVVLWCRAFGVVLVVFFGVVVQVFPRILPRLTLDTNGDSPRCHQGSTCVGLSDLGERKSLQRRHWRTGKTRNVHFHGPKKLANVHLRWPFGLRPTRL